MQGSKFTKIFGKMGTSFGRVNGNAFKMSPFGIAILVPGDGNYVYYDGNSSVNVMDMVFDAEGMIFAIPVLEVAEKDLILIEGEKPAYVKTVEKDRLTVFNPLENKEEVYIPQKSLMGIRFFTKVVCPFQDMFSGAAGKEENPMQALLPMMMFSEGGMDAGMIMAMQGMSGGTNQFANLLPMMLMSNSSGSDNSSMIMMMMAMQGMSGGTSPFANILGGNAASQAPREDTDPKLQKE